MYWTFILQNFTNHTTGDLYQQNERSFKITKNFMFYESCDPVYVRYNDKRNRILTTVAQCTFQGQH